MSTCSFSLRGEFSELPELQAEVRSFLEAEQVAPDPAYTVQLAVEEIVTNIIKYAGSGDGLRLTVTRTGEAVLLRFEDAGRPFDPTEPRDAAAPGGLSEGRVGGLGLRLVRALCADLRYSRTEGHNRLQVHVPLAK